MITFPYNTFKRQKTVGMGNITRLQWQHSQGWKCLNYKHMITTLLSFYMEFIVQSFFNKVNNWTLIVSFCTKVSVWDSFRQLSQYNDVRRKILRPSLFVTADAWKQRKVTHSLCLRMIRISLALKGLSEGMNKVLRKVLVTLAFKEKQTQKG